MQLFLCEREKNWEILLLQDADILHQMRKVLRMNVGDIFFVQNTLSERYKVRIDSRDKAFVKVMAIEKIKNTSTRSMVSLAVAMPNKRDKAELIAQKLTEIGIDSLLFRVAERSVIKQANAKKMERIHKIVKEATEQSWSWYMPSVKFVEDISTLCHGKDCIVFDTSDAEICSSVSLGEQIIGIVWPEWWLTPRDYTYFSHCVVSGLGKNILRTETAAIVAGWHLQHISWWLW